MLLLWAKSVLFFLLMLSVGKSETVQTKVLVLGAGMAGISAARNLNQSGLTEFIILEGNSRVGGRVWSATFGGKTIELGANWVHGYFDNNPVWRLVKSYNMTGHVSNWDSITVRNITGQDVTSQWHTVNSALEGLDEALYGLAISLNATRQPDMPLRAALMLNGWNPKSSIEKAVEYAAADHYLGEPPDVSSLLAWLNHVEFAGDFFVMDQRGYVYVIEQMVQSFLTKDDQRLKFNKTVSRIQWGDNGVTVTTKDGSIYTAEYAIVTFSMGVLQGNSVEFVPGLPEWKREAICRVRMALYTKIFLKFSFKFWDDGEKIVFVGDRRGYYTVWENMEAEGLFPAGTNILLVTLVDEEARRVEAQPDEATQAEIMDVLRIMYGDSIPDPVDILVPKWGQDPFFRGSYSNRGVGLFYDGQRKLQAPVAGRLFVAGEGTARQYGTLHGAYFEGTRVADAIVTCVGGGPCEEEYQPPRRGCTCPSADNFDSQATEDDGSCRYPSSGGNGLMSFSKAFYLSVLATVSFNPI